MILVDDVRSLTASKNSGLCSLFLIVLLGNVLFACSPTKQFKSLTYSGPIMGTDFRITVVLPAERDGDILFEKIKTTMQDVEQSMSTYLSDSELSRFNAAPADRPIEISAGLAEVLSEALTISRLSDGFFDVTVGGLVNAWGFGPDGRIEAQPSAGDLRKLEQSVGYRKLSLNGRRLSKTDDRVMIDLSAIAKGYAVDQVASYLGQQGVQHFLIDIGGELRAAGRNIDKQLWRVGIERPEMQGGIDRIVALNNKAIATSGDYRNFLMIDGQKFSHTIDPKAMRPVLHRLALVSVIAEQASTADALATALMAMGETRAQQFARQNQLAAYFVIRNQQSGGYTTKITSQFLPNLQ